MAAREYISVTGEQWKAVNNTTLSAVHHVRRMRGGSQAHLMYASDRNYYVVKFQNTPQHVRVLANEFLATKIGLALGLPMAPVSKIDVSEWLITHTPELRIQTESSSFPCACGLQLASRYACDLWQGEVFDHMPESMLDRVANTHELIQILAFDKWVGNCDGRQVVFTKPNTERFYQMTGIDQGYCFNAAEWTFPDHPLHGIYRHTSVYQNVTGWESFEPILSRIESFDSQVLWGIATEIPSDWYQEDVEGLTQLVDKLLLRCRSVRGLITALRASTRNPFRQWSKNQVLLPSMKNGLRVSG